MVSLISTLSWTCIERKLCLLSVGMNYLHKYVSCFALIYLLSLSGFSQEKEQLLPEIQRIQDAYEDSLRIASAPIVKLGKQYKEALNRELEKAQDAGDFEEVIAIKKAADKFNKGKLLDGTSDSPEIEKLEKIVSKQLKIRLKAAEKPALDAAKNRISQLKKSLKELTQNGNFESAEKVHNYIKSLPSKYDSIWITKEINRLINVPVVQVESSHSFSSNEKDNLKLIPQKTDIPEILSVSIEPKKISINEVFEISITAVSMHELDRVVYGFQFNGSDGSNFVNVGSSEIVSLGESKWAISCKIRFINPLQVGTHELVILTVENKKLQKVSNNWFSSRSNKPIKITVRD